MSPNRKAEIQRKLTLTAVPKPPAGLADRIKRDIPNHLTATEVERERFSRSIAFNMRVAASILLLITSVFVTINLLVPDAPQMKSPATAVAPQRSVPLPDVAAASTAAVDELRVQISEERQAVAHVAQTTAPATELEPAANTLRDEAPAREDREKKLEVASADDAAGFAMAEPTASPIVTAPAAAPAPPPAAMPETMTITQNAPVIVGEVQGGRIARTGSRSLVKEAVASDLELAPKRSVFGISVDPHAFERIRSTIEKGSRPPASTVNVEALVNYFAGSPKSIRRDVQLEAEGSPAPVDVNGRRGIVRFTVDTRSGDVAGNASTPPVGTDARVEIVFNKHAVASYERIGDTDAISPEATLLANTSVTGLYAVDLKPGVTKRTRIATVTLRYKSVADGREISRFAVVDGADFSRTWTLASRRHRLASLGAVWGETLKGSGGGPDVAVKAEELATQEPKDAKAKELAAAASASSGSER